ncbi:hypothetical protein [Pseudomonas sp. Irchel 3F6]|uniref:hypothetical protein n=1 Tax=Pseudomonas sp. Irchel 3F6 TaxID=2009003 RepID=UPI00117BC7F7|nr:hypothetical protein [Pseudomonas sp. Irchel 3F6]
MLKSSIQYSQIATTGHEGRRVLGKIHEAQLQIFPAASSVSSELVERRNADQYSTEFPELSKAIDQSGAPASTDMSGHAGQQN